MQKSVFPSEKGATHLVPGGLVMCRPSQLLRNPKFYWLHLSQSHVLIIWVCLFLSVLFLTTGMIEENTACVPEQLLQRPEVPFVCPWTSLCYLITANTKKKIMENNQRAIPC